MKHFAKILCVVMVLLIFNFAFAQTQLEDNNKESNAYFKANKKLTNVYNKVLKKYKVEVELSPLLVCRAGK
jgi:hypothetical protein